VPFLARWIWRFYFRFGDWSAIHIPAETTAPDVPADTAEIQPEIAAANVFDQGFFGWLRGNDIWTSVLRDCFQGQIITICLVAVFVVVFLIREWVMQNAVQAVDDNIAPGNQWDGAQQMMAALERAAQAVPPVVPPPDEQQPQDEDDDAEDEAHDDDDEFPIWGREIEADDRRREQERRLLETNIFDPPPPPPPQTPPREIIVPDPPRPMVDIRRNDFEDDDLDGDEFDGLWDILGMQGPIIGLLHNTVFSALMIALAVGLGVWLPFMFGKTALGTLVSPPPCGVITILMYRPIQWRC